MASAGLPTAQLVSLLTAMGVGLDEIRRSEADGTFVLLAIDRLALGQELRYDISAACLGTGLPEGELRHIWRSLGFPDPQPGELVFSSTSISATSPRWRT